VALERLKYGRIPSLLKHYQSLIFISQNAGTVVPATLLPAEENIAGDTLPQVTVGGTLTMTFRQINADGAGPMTCQVSADGTDNFQTMQVTTNVPGNNGNSKVEDTDFVSLLLNP
jgi:hypothetical protein